MNSRWLPFTHSASMYGPLPTAVVEEVSRFAVLSQFGAGIENRTIRTGRIGSGSLVMMSTVNSSTFFAPCNVPYSLNA